MGRSGGADAGSSTRRPRAPTRQQGAVACWRGLFNLPPARRAERLARRELEALADRNAAATLGDTAPVIGALIRLGQGHHRAPAAALLFSGDDIDHRLDRLARRSSPSAVADRVVLAGVTVAAAATILTACAVLHTRWLTAGVLACAGLTALLTYLLPLRTHA